MTTKKEVMCEPKYPDIHVQLSGEDCNVFSVMGVVTKKMRREGISPEEINEFRDQAMAGDYDHLLRTCMKWVSVA